MPWTLFTPRIERYVFQWVCLTIFIIHHLWSIKHIQNTSNLRLWYVCSPNQSCLFLYASRLKYTNQILLINRLSSQEMKPACRYGPHCRKLSTGDCRFYHPRQQGSSNFGNTSVQRQNYHHNYQQNYQPNYEPRYKSRNRNYRPEEQRHSHANQNAMTASRQHEDVLRQLCREYHYGLDCRFGGVDTCKKKHNFIATQSEKLKRIYLQRTINVSPAKLTTFQSGGQSYQVLRLGNEIKFYLYSHELSSLTEIYHYSLPSLTNKYLFYNHSNEYIYFSCENEQTGCTDIGYYNLERKQHYYIANSHLGKVTGMAHVSEDTMLSSCTNGEIKVWTRKEEEFVINADLTNRLMNGYNPNNNKIELLFLDLHVLNDVQLFTVGTSDARLLFFIGAQLSFNEIAFDANLYSNVYKIKYTVQSEVPYAVVLTWNREKTLSSLLAINLANSQVQVLVQVQHGLQEVGQIITEFQVAQEYLLVGNFAGQVSVYRFADTRRKIGGILHQNPIGDIVYTCDEIKSTNLKLMTIFIMEKKSEEREGSLGIYLLK